MKKIFTVNLPDIGEGVVEGEVIEWLHKVGDPILQDEPIVIVMTDKATVELPAPYPGILSKQYFKVAEIAIKDKPLYDIELTEEVATKDSSDVIENLNKAIDTLDLYHPPIEKQASSEEIKPYENQVLAIPIVRKMAEELGIDIAKVKGSGKNGRILIEDLKNYIKSEKDLSEDHLLHLPDDSEKPLVGIRHLMAKKMMESKNNIPHFSYFEQLDATRLVKLKQNYQAKALSSNTHVTYMPFILRALSLTLTSFPEVNSSFDMVHNKLILHKPHNIGIAITSTYGLIVPVIKNVQNLKLNDLILAYEDLKRRALSNSLDPNEMKESTITVTNFGVFGGRVEFATPIINYPEVAILGVAKIQKEPVIKDDLVIAQETLHLSWSFDHRVIDGQMAASFSHHFASLLQNPATLLS